MATLKVSVMSEFSPRRKMRYFQVAVLRAARLLMNGGPCGNTTVAAHQLLSYGQTDTAPYANNAANFAAVEGLCRRPWRKSTGTVDLQASICAQGAGYIVGDVLSVAVGGGTGATFMVASVAPANGGVCAVTQLTSGSGYGVGYGVATTPATVQVTPGSGCTLNIRPTYEATIDVMDQVRIDAQVAYSGKVQSQSGMPKYPTIKDWGSEATYGMLTWLTATSGNTPSLTGVLPAAATWTTLPYPSSAAFPAYSGTPAYSVGDVVVSGGNFYYCQATTTAGTVTSNGTYWVRCAKPFDVVLASIAARLAGLAAE